MLLAEIFFQAVKEYFTHIVKLKTALLKPYYVCIICRSCADEDSDFIILKWRPRFCISNGCPHAADVKVRGHFNAIEDYLPIILYLPHLLEWWKFHHLRFITVKLFLHVSKLEMKIPLENSEKKFLPFSLVTSWT